MKSLAEVIIRTVRREEISSVYEIERISFKQPYPQSFLESLLIIAGDLFLVAKVKERVIGYAVALLRGGVLGHVISIAVHPDFRKRGVGAALLKELLSRLRSKGAQFVRLEVRISNRAAIKLYKKFGFKEIYLVPNYYPDGEACYVMVKEL